MSTSVPTTPEASPLATGDALRLPAALAAGALLGLLFLPAWLPDLSASLQGPEPKVFWHLARATGFAAYALLWLSLALGLGITNRLARLWPGGPAAVDLHRYTSYLGLVCTACHATLLLGDRYFSFQPLQIVVPFLMTEYEPFWVGLGQIGFYLAAVVTFSFSFRRVIGPTVWRRLHYLSFAVYIFILAHGIGSGSDTASPVAAWLYWLSGAGLLFLTIYRVLSAASRTPKSGSRAAHATR